MDLNTSAVWRTIRSQQLEAPLSNERDDNDVSGYVMDALEPEQDLIAKELQASTIERITLGIDFDDTDILRMKKDDRKRV